MSEVEWEEKYATVTDGNGSSSLTYMVDPSADTATILVHNQTELAHAELLRRRGLWSMHKQVVIKRVFS